MSEDQKAEAKTERELAVEAKQTELTAINDKREGKGTRLQVGQTRGKNPQIVVWEAFDESKPGTLPASVDEFMKLSGLSDVSDPKLQESQMIGYLIDGFNTAAYTAASDPVAEYMNPAWDDERKKGFRTVVKNYASNVGCSIEDSATLIKVGFEKAFAASQQPK